MSPADGPLLLYDARCSVCLRFVQWFIHADSAGDLRIAPLQGRYGDSVRGAEPAFGGRDSAIWIPQGGVPIQRSAAVLAVMRHVGGPWRVAAAAGQLVPRVIRDWIYSAFARNRRYFGWMGLEEFDAMTRSRILSDDQPREDYHAT